MCVRFSFCVRGARHASDELRIIISEDFIMCLSMKNTWRFEEIFNSLVRCCCVFFSFIDDYSIFNQENCMSSSMQSIVLFIKEMKET